MVLRRRLQVATQKKAAGGIVNALKELCRTAWSRWYVRGSLASTLIVWLWLNLCHTGLFETNWNTCINPKMIEQLNFLEWASHLDADGQKKLAEAQSLMSLQQFLTDWQVILGAGLFVGYFGFSLDAGYKWLRRKQTSQRSVVGKIGVERGIPIIEAV